MGTFHSYKAPLLREADGGCSPLDLINQEIKKKKTETHA